MSNSSQNVLERLKIDYVSGTVAGVAQALVGHPFDLVKSRMQTSAPSIGCGSTTSIATGSLLGNVKSIISNEGVRGLYKGVTPPIVVSGLITSLIFATNSFAINILSRHSNTSLPTPSLDQKLSSFVQHTSHHEIHAQTFLSDQHDESVGDQLLSSFPPSSLSTPSPSLGTIIVASWIASVLPCAILTPVELVKVKLQTQSASAPLYKGPIDCIAKTARQQGIRGLFRGYTLTLSSRLVGHPFYFGIYETVKRGCTPANSAPSTLTLLFAGGLGGVGFWAANFPLDLMKTIVQVKGIESLREARDLAIENWRKSGIKWFYRGFTPCIIRAFPANAVCFLAFESTASFLRQSP